jgi:hypothetical protein
MSALVLGGGAAAQMGTDKAQIALALTPAVLSLLAGLWQGEGRAPVPSGRGGRPGGLNHNLDRGRRYMVDGVAALRPLRVARVVQRGRT